MSVDAIELLIGIKRFLKSELTHDEKKLAMGIKTINQIVDYVEGLARVSGREALDSKGQKLFMAAIFAFHTGKAVVRIAAIQIPINNLLDVRASETVLS